MAIQLSGCTGKKLKSSFLEDLTSSGSPVAWFPELVSEGEIVHRGIFSNDLNEYYYVISDTAFSNFKVKIIKRQNGSWSKSEDAFFNSSFSDHGMSFSPDGNTLVFSSTRPAGINGISDTWHLWKCSKMEGKWSNPEFVNLTGLEEMLVSHPTLDDEGTLYFHASSPDYSNMALYYSTERNGEYSEPEKIDFRNFDASLYCTPYVSSDGQLLLFATLGKGLDLYLSKKENGSWGSPVKLPDLINTRGQGNPYLTLDSRYLLYARENESGNSGWNIYLTGTESFIDQ